MGASPARIIAFEVLRRVETQRAYASDVLHAELSTGIKSKDASLATELTLGVLRWRRLLDFLLERQLRKPVERLDVEVALALRLGLYQLRFLERIPARAAIHEAAELVKRARKRSAAALVNAVLRRTLVEARAPVEKFLPPALTPGERLGILHSHPTWMVERWLKTFGERRTIALLKSNNQPAPLACAVHIPRRRNEIVEELSHAGLRAEDGCLCGSAIRVSGGSPTRTEAFRRGWISVQDEASQLIPSLLGVTSGQSVLDVCAAPGGKTVPLAQLAGPAGFLVGTDRHSHRLRALRTNLDRCGRGSVPLVELDAEEPLPFCAKFDRILVDAPCSGTGTLARHPEIRWRVHPEDFTDLHRRQVALLCSGLAQLRPGGKLVYSTCSLEPEENEEVIAEASRNSRDTQIAPPGESAAPLQPHLSSRVSSGQLFDATGFFHTFPPDHHSDGFFAAVLEKIRRESR